MASNLAVLQALNAARDESILALMLLCGVGLVYFQLGFDSRENLAWCLVLLSQSLPFLSALIVSILSTAPNRDSVQSLEKTA